MSDCDANLKGKNSRIYNQDRTRLKKKSSWKEFDLMITWTKKPYLLDEKPRFVDYNKLITKGLRLKTRRVDYNEPINKCIRINAIKN